MRQQMEASGPPGRAGAKRHHCCWLPARHRTPRSVALSAGLAHRSVRRKPGAGTGGSKLDAGAYGDKAGAHDRPFAEKQGEAHGGPGMALIHSVDSLELAQVISKDGPGKKGLVPGHSAWRVNIGREESKSGVCAESSWSRLAGAMSASCRPVRVRGIDGNSSHFCQRTWAEPPLFFRFAPTFR